MQEKRPALTGYLLSYQLNSKHNGPVLLFKVTFRHLGCFLLSVAMNGKDEHGFET